MINKLLLIIFIIIYFVGVNGNSCHSCITREFEGTFDDYMNVPRNPKIMFPLGKHACNITTKITCNGECVGVKIEEFKKENGLSVGYVHGCAEHVMQKKKLQNSPTPEGQKYCDKPEEFLITYSLRVKVSYCRCQDEMCNNPERDFVNADYIPPPSSQMSLSRSEIRLPGADVASSAPAAITSSISSTSKAATLATTVIGANAFAISFSSHYQIDPIKFILSNLLAFLIYQLF